MRTLHLILNHGTYVRKYKSDTDLWVLSLPLCDSTGEDVKDLVQNPKFNCTTGNNFGLMLEDDPNKITIFDIFGDDPDNPLSITLDREILYDLWDQFIPLKKQKPDEIIIEQHDNDRFSVRGVFYPKKADA
jgi:hypothetical protein